MIFTSQISSSLYMLLFTTALGVEWVGRTSSRQLTDVKDRKLPLFRPLRRVVQNFEKDRTASITIVFQRGDTMPEMRWFRQVEPKTLPNAEIANMINIKGDPRYSVKTLSSFDVTAATLTIRPVPHLTHPVKFVTCFSYRNESFQYQLDTTVDVPVNRSVDNLDGIVWQQAPESHVLFAPELKVDCAAKLESESTRYTDELNIYRSLQSRVRMKNGTLGSTHFMTSSLCGKIHKERGGFTEKSGKFVTEARRYADSDVTGRRGHMFYEVKFTVLNGSMDDMGVYTCAVERAHDRTYISSWVYSAGVPSPPLMMFEPCEDGVPEPTGSSPRGLHYQIRVLSNRPSCVRCRVYSRLPAHIILTRGGVPIESSEYIQLDRHMNVADGGMSELTVTFLDQAASGRLQPGDVSGEYRCVSDNDWVHFDVTVVRPSMVWN